MFRDWTEFPDHQPAREPGYVIARQQAAAMPPRQPEAGQVRKGSVMGYSDTELRNAYLADEVARLQNEHHGLFAFANSNRPSYGIVPDPEPTLADLTDDDIDGAVAELAAQRGISITELGEQCC